MTFSDFIIDGAIITELKAATKKDAIHEMVQALADAGAFGQEDVQEVASAIHKREAIGSTGLGSGIAVPHTRKATCVDRVVGAVGICAEPGIDFDSLDGEPVQAIFMLISSPDVDASKALSYVGNKIKNSEFVSYIKQTKTRKEVKELLVEADAGGEDGFGD
ncbi:MAG: PTS sugar transporter subunit IIA [Thermoguttaceae bacterium]|jgi:mannitol/fructose-specific phosphotransferase system IIA component (Ntr-type)